MDTQTRQLLIMTVIFLIAICLIAAIVQLNGDIIQLSALTGSLVGTALGRIG